MDANGRGEKIRTSDPLHPMQVRYQAALRPDRDRNYNRLGPRRLGDFRYRSSILRMLLSSLRMLPGESGCGTVIVLVPAAWAGTGGVLPAGSSRRLRAPLMVNPCSYRSSRMRRIR